MIRLNLARFAFCALAILLGGARFSATASAADVPAGNWLEVACNEGESGPDLPPPPYLKGIIRISGQMLLLSSRIYDDKNCTVLRPGTIAELKVPFTVDTGVTTTDGSIAINAVLTDPDDTSTSAMYGLLKFEGGQMSVAFYPSAEARPKSLERGQAQVFAPF